jgi:hypothetical protein
MTKLYLVRSSELGAELKITTNWYDEASQSEIDAAASEQMRQDAEVGRAIRGLEDVNKPGYVVLFDLNHVIIDTEIGAFVGDGATLRAALIAAGLLEEVTP